MKLRKPLFVLILAAAAPMLHPQGSTGAISLTITDTTGAVIPEAAVTVTGSDTHVVLRQLKTNGQGNAEVPLVPPGRYNIDVSAQGFKSFLQQAVDV